MKVIYAGYSKTGTKSIACAFRELGYKTYDYFENSKYLGGEWKRLLKHGGTAEDFRRMYEGVDAVTDTPCNILWEEILEAFPEAKVIISIRDEESWIRSIEQQRKAFVSDPLYILMQVCSYSGWQHFHFQAACARILLWAERRWPWTKSPDNKMLWRRLYRNHNNYVLQNAPKDKLLVYDFKDGWRPICEFLGEPIPDKPFPRENVGSSVTKVARKANPIVINMMRETAITLGIISVVGLYAGFKVYQNWGILRGSISGVEPRFKFW